MLQRWALYEGIFKLGNIDRKGKIIKLSKPLQNMSEAIFSMSTLRHEKQVSQWSIILE